jgi:hypothetical protein
MASTPSPAVVTQPLHSHADALLSGAAPPEADLIRPFTPEEEPGIGGELAKNSSETPAVHAPSHASGAADVVQLPSWHDDDNPGGDGGRQHDAKHNMSAHAASGMLASSPLASVARVSKTLLARELPSTSEGGNQPRSGWSLGSLAVSCWKLCASLPACYCFRKCTVFFCLLLLPKLYTRRHMSGLRPCGC